MSGKGADVNGEGADVSGKGTDLIGKEADVSGKVRHAPIPRGGRKARGKIRIAAGPVRLEATRSALVVGAAAAALLAAVGLVHIGTGSTPIGAEEIVKVLFGHSGDEQTVRIVETVRLPRFVAALAVGAALGAAGAVFQSVSRNPLGSPDVIGFTTGAATGGIVSVAVLAGEARETAFAATCGGMATATAVYLLARRAGHSTGYQLVLVGIGVSSFLTAVNSLLLAYGDAEQTALASMWLSGSLNARTWEQALVVAVAVVLLVPALCGMSRRLDILEMGDDQATQAGIRPERLRIAAMLAAVALTSTAVAATGPIAFVALAAPQAVARLTRSGRLHIFTSALMGSTMLTAADVASMRVPVGVDVPVGLATALIGGVYLLWLIARSPTV